MKNSVRDIYLTFNHGAMEFGKLHSALEKALMVDEGVIVEFGTGRGVAGRLMMPMLHGQWYYTVDPYAPYSKGDIDPWESVNQHQKKGDDFYIQGKEIPQNFKEYTSHNTKRLKVDEIIKILLKLDFIKRSLKS